MTGEEKAALLLKSLGPEVTETVLAQVPSESGVRLRAYLQRWEQTPPAPESLNQVLGELDTLLEELAQTSPSPGHSPVVAEEPKTEKKDAAATPKPGPQTTPVEIDETGAPLVQLRQLEVDRLASALQGEQPRTVVLLLNALPGERGGEVLKRLPTALRREASLMLGQPLAVPKEVLERIALAVLKKSQTVEEKAAEDTPAARYKKMADMLRLLEKQERLEIVAALEERDSEAAAGVKENLYHFEDLLLIEDRSMQKLLSEVDSKSLALAIKGASEPISTKVLNNLSKRAREALTEEMEFLGTPSTAQAQQAQKMIVEVIQRLDQAGELVMVE